MRLTKSSRNSNKLRMNSSKSSMKSRVIIYLQIWDTKFITFDVQKLDC